MPIAMTVAQARAVLRDGGHDAQGLTPLKGGAWSTVFGFSEAGQDYVVKFHDRRDDLEKDRFAQRWASPALRTPRVIEIDEIREGAYAILPRVAGAPIDGLDEAGMRAVLPSLFAAMDAMREADLTGTRGFGLWHGDGTAPYTSWRDNLLLEEPPGERGAQRKRLAATPIGTAEFDAGLKRIQELQPFCPEERHLVHNDLLYNNVFRDEQGIVMLDWGASLFGDFLYDVALLTVWWPWYAKRWGGIDIQREVEAHYAEIGFHVPAFRERLRCYELDIGVSHIAYQAEHEEWDKARWTAARTLELVRAPIDG
ncbi:MAG: aminoglycoside phosphotransferase family protein [Chloroflexi bacterium]|nr:MAG: aminoglycoside phosphotransferase family protein [Chloroflexota bacterium]